MGWKATIAKLAAAWIVPTIYRKHKNAIQVQQNLLLNLTQKAANTQFGKEHHFEKIKNYNEFKAQVPVRDYEEMKLYIEKIAAGEEDVLWIGKPLYFCKSSGTTSGTKYIPLTAPSIKSQINAARNALLHYVYETGRADFFDRKMIFLQGSPELDSHGKIPSGRLSGIVYHHVPAYLHKSRMPNYEINCIDDWEQKVEAIADETIKEDMSLISGIPPWVIMYFEKVLKKSGKKTIREVFPDFKLFAYGGVNYEPYRAKIESLIGFAIDGVETYPASEGFIAYQDSQKEKGLLLNIDGGIFYEFIEVEKYIQGNYDRIDLSAIELNVNYALILSSDAGLWAYNIGDTVRFISKAPYRLIVTGRIKHFISAFGEHVIAEEVEFAMQQSLAACGAEITEFTVAPVVETSGELPYHEWFVEFSKEPNNKEYFAELLDSHLQDKNSYYRDLRIGNVLQRLKVTVLPKGVFNRYMKSIGKLGGQNKFPRLTNDRNLVNAVLNS